MNITREIFIIDIQKSKQIASIYLKCDNFFDITSEYTENKRDSRLKSRLLAVYPPDFLNISELFLEY